jgi:hypothetical protein
MKNGRSRKLALKKAVRSYLREGYAPVPIPLGKKAPTRRGWQKLRISTDEGADYFRDVGNVGLLLGKPSAGLIDLDLDEPEAIEVAEAFLPPTEMIHGRDSKPSSHRWYQVAKVPAPLKFCDPDGGSCLLEIRSTGQQTKLIPPP